MGALRILTSRTLMWVSPAGKRGSREKVEEEEAVGSWVGGEDFSFITLLLLPSEKW